MFKLRLIQVTSILLVATACDGASEAVAPPPPIAQPAEAPVSAPAPAFPGVSLSATVFNGSDALYGWIASTHGGVLASRYVFEDSTRFSLQFASPRFGFFEYRGTYYVDGSTILLYFDSDSRWTAEAKLSGDILDVRYSIIASLSDFADGTYVRTSNR